MLYVFSVAGRIARPLRRGWTDEWDGLRRFAKPENGRSKIFIWIRRNPLKSPDSAKGIQGNASFFPWFYLD
jgi:hypothetical protein